MGRSLVLVDDPRFVPVLHHVQPLVVVGHLPEMHQGDLAGEDGVVVRHVRAGVAAPVLEFDHHAATERLELDPFPGQVDLEHLGHGFGLLRGEALAYAVSHHRSRLPFLLRKCVLNGSDQVGPNDTASAGPSAL